MKFENLMLHTLFAACVLICVTALGSMLVAGHRATTLAHAYQQNHRALTVPVHDTPSLSDRAGKRADS